MNTPPPKTRRRQLLLQAMAAKDGQCHCLLDEFKEGEEVSAEREADGKIAEYRTVRCDNCGGLRSCAPILA